MCGKTRHWCQQYAASPLAKFGKQEVILNLHRPQADIFEQRASA
jgi:hypothetical protein